MRLVLRRRVVHHIHRPALHDRRPIDVNLLVDVDILSDVIVDLGSDDGHLHRPPALLPQRVRHLVVANKYGPAKQIVNGEIVAGSERCGEAIWLLSTLASGRYGAALTHTECFRRIAFAEVTQP